MTDDQLQNAIQYYERLLEELKTESRKRNYMPDITKCRDSICQMKDRCYRYVSEVSDLQSYFSESPRDEKTGECRMFWDDGSKIIEKLKQDANKNKG